MLGAAALALAAGGLLLLARPWHPSPPPPAYRVVVSSGDPLVRRGDPVTLSAFVEPTGPDVGPPVAAVLVLRSLPNGAEARLPMAGDGSTAFHLTLPAATADAEYRVEVGPAASDRHTITVVDAAGLAEGSWAEVVPPAYAASAVPKKTVRPLAAVEGLSHSTAVLHLAFTRPPAAAFLEFRPEPGAGPPVQLPLLFAQDRANATATTPLDRAGAFRLITVAEASGRRFQTETSVPVRVVPDAPPRLVRVTGLPRWATAVRPGEVLEVEVGAADDIGVGSVGIEWANSHVPVVHREVIPLVGPGTPHAAGRFAFRLDGSLGEGDRLRLRVRVSDGRTLTEPPLGPQASTYPSAGWVELAVSAAAPPLDHQAIGGEREALAKVAGEATARVRRATEEVAIVRAEATGSATLATDQIVRLENAAAAAHAAAAGGATLAADPGLPDEVQPLLADLLDVARRPLARAEEAIRGAAADTPSSRDAALTRAAADLADATGRLAQLSARNDRLARDRLDRRTLAALAAEVVALVDAPPADAAVGRKRILDRLAVLPTESPPIRDALATLAARDAHALGRRASELVALQRELARAVRQTRDETRTAVRDPLVRRQRELAEHVAAFAARAATASRLVGRPAPDAADALRTADRLAGDEFLAALTGQERLAQDLDRLGEAFEAWAADRRDPREAARQLARWQADLRTRVAAAAKPGLPDVVKASFRAEQDALLATAERLHLPPGDDVTAARDVVRLRSKEAADALGGDAAGADAAIAAAADALTVLADRTPPLADRLALALKALDPVRADQEAVAAVADGPVRTFAKPPDPAALQALTLKLAPAAGKQAALADRVAALDLPTLVLRQGRTVAALRAAADDLRDGLVYDVPASQAAAKRELDRLRTAVEGGRPVDAFAAALARRQAALANATTGPDVATPRQRTAWLAEQRDLARLLDQVVAPEAPSLLADAREAARRAEVAVRDDAPADDFRAKSRAAADAFAKLSERLYGGESDRDRVKRLARARHAAAAEAAAQAGKPPAADLAADARRRLQREGEELAFTRVGPAQLTRKKVIDLFAKLRAKPETDRQAGVLKALAVALDELAEVVPEPATLVASPEDASEKADAYWPSAPLAAAARDLARRQRDLRDAAARAEEDAARRLTPADADPLAALEVRQRALARDAASGPDAVDSATRAADYLRVGRVRDAKEAAEDAARHLRRASKTADRQEALAAALTSYLDDTPAAVARQHARRAELAIVAATFARDLEAAARVMLTAVPTRDRFAAAAGHVREAGKNLAPPPGPPPADPDRRSQAALDSLLQAEDALDAIPDPPADAEPDAGVATALREAGAVLSEPNATGEGMRKGADALRRAAAAVGRGGK